MTVRIPSPPLPSTVALVACLLTAGCSLETSPPTGLPPGQELERATLEFSTRVIRPGSGPIPEVGAEGERGAISVRGAVGSELPCFVLDGQLTVDDQSVEVDVLARANETCQATVDTIAYTGRVEELEAGSYAIRITHVEGASREVVLDATVEVE